MVRKKESKVVRDKNIIFRVTDEEKKKIHDLAAKLGVTVTDLLLTGVDLIEERIEGLKNPTMRDVWRDSEFMHDLKKSLKSIEKKVDLIKKLTEEL